MPNLTEFGLWELRDGGNFPIQNPTRVVPEVNLGKPGTISLKSGTISFPSPETTMKFFPEEILFVPTTKCNLQCPHCNVKQSDELLPQSLALKFLKDCKRHRINKIGFTGGEPFLALDFLTNIVKTAVANKMWFDRIMTNGLGAWLDI